MKLLYSITLSALLLLAHSSAAQNMAYNGDFESYTSCPGFVSYITLSNYWQSVSNNRSAYFHACSTLPFAATPGNTGGYQVPRSGSGYAYFMSRSCASCNVSYVQGTLKTPLTAGTVYYFEMYVSLTDSSQRANGKLGVYFSQSVISTPATTVLPYTPQVVSDTFITDKLGWTKVSGMFTASGGEQYFTIGDFSTNYLTDFVSLSASPSPSSGSSFYYLDDVFISEGCDSAKKIFGSDRQVCGDSTVITQIDASTPKFTSYLWSTGSTQPAISINRSGTYHVTLTNHLCVLRDSITVTYKPLPLLSLGNDTLICSGDSVKIGKDIGPITYLWNTGVIAPYTTVSTSGSYILITAANGCVSRDTITVTVIPKPAVNLGSDTILCGTGAITLTTSIADSTSLWSTGSRSPAIQVNMPGLYWLEMNSYGCTARDSILVTQTSLRPFSLGNDTAICEDASLVLHADSSYGTRFNWSTGHTQASVRVNTSGIYWVDASSGSCTIRDSITISTKPLPVVTLGADRLVCEPVSETLDAGNPGATYLWSTGSTQRSVMISQARQYWVRVTQNGCSGYDTLLLTPEIAPVVNLGNDTVICSGESFMLYATSPGATYKWQDSSVASFFRVALAGKYTVEVTRGICRVKDSVTVYVFQKPVLDLGKDTGSCFVTGVTLRSPITADQYLWQDGSRLDSLHITAPGMYWLEIRQSACRVRDSIEIRGYPFPFVDLGQDRNICKEDSVILNAGNIGSLYRWQDLDTSRIRTMKAPGTIYVSVTNTFHCVTTDSITLDTFPSPAITLSGDSIICEGQQVTIDAGNGFSSYRWQDGSQRSFFNTRAAGSYHVTVTDANGCAASDGIMLAVKSLPVANEWKTTYLSCEPDLVITPGKQFSSYLWGNGSTTPAQKISAYGTYEVTVTDHHNCSNTFVTEVHNICPGTVYAPNAFTPNGDMINDIFIPVYKNIRHATLRIFDRWGQLLFETSELNKGWNGIYNNSEAFSGMYIYSVTYTGMDNTTQSLSGNVTLLR
jgi:gliding motility-associated-like protein